MKLERWFVVLALSAVGCGDLTSQASPPRADAGTDVGADDSRSADGASTETGDAGSVDSASTEEDSSSDGGTFACGETFCREDQICFYPPCGCVVPTEPLTDAGSCPDGATFSDLLDICIAPFTCQPPSCGSPGPVGGRLGCSGQDGSIPTDAVVPLPKGSSHICYADCV